MLRIGRKRKNLEIINLFENNHDEWNCFVLRDDIHKDSSENNFLEQGFTQFSYHAEFTFFQ